jgi:hypothetical protein
MKNAIFLIIILSSFLIACTEIIELDLNQGENNRLVVEGSITNQYKTHQVKLSRTSDYFINQASSPELAALVSITDGDTTINLYDQENNGIYTTDKLYAGKVGHKYTLNITLENGEKYAAEETILPISPLDSVKYEYGKSEIPFDKNYYYNINIFVQESPEKGNYYLWELFIDGQYVTDTLRLKVFVSDEMVNGSYIANWTVYSLPDYKIKNDTSEITLQMFSISKEKFEFYYAILLETDFSGGGFSGPPANVPTNISNGALGFFSASAVTENRLKIIKLKK